MKKLGLFAVAMASILGLAGCKPAGPKTYTIESAMNEVVDLVNKAFELEGDDKEEATKASDDEYYWFMNFGNTVTEEQLMAFVDQKLLVSDFTAKSEEWGEEEDDGTTIYYRDFQWNKVVLEYLVYEQSGNENPNYDGVYLLIESVRGFLDWIDADDINHFLDVEDGSLPTITIPEDGEYKFRFFEEGKLGDESPKQLVGLFYFNCEEAFDTALKAANWTYRSIGGGYYGYFNEDATLFILLSYEPADDEYDEMTIVQMFAVSDLFE